MDESMIYMRKSDVSRLRYGTPDESSYFVFLGKDYRKADSLKKKISRIPSLPSAARIHTYSELEPFIQSYFEITDQFTWIMYMFILAGFGIVLFESVVMSIFERMREIGILHALGSPPTSLFMLVILEAFFLTLGGAVISLFPGLSLMGYLSRAGVNFEGLQMSGMSWGGGVGIVYPYVTFQDVLTGIAIAGVVSLFSGIYPAFKAVRLSPIKAIYGR